METIVHEEKNHELSVDLFIKIVRKYSDVKKLTHEILHEFIDKIVVHHRKQIYGQTVQRVEIYYKMIGKAPVPHMSKVETEKYLKIFGTDKNKRTA